MKKKIIDSIWLSISFMLVAAYGWICGWICRSTK